MEMLERFTGWHSSSAGQKHQYSSSYLTLPTSPTPDAVDAYPYGHSRPSLSRLLADFTLGFADGLTVPFALTAGLSSLGQTNTVIYAGTAEICAGCISMGIGGYLAAKGEESRDSTSGDDFSSDGESDCEKLDSTSINERQEIDDYLAPLQLPSDLLRIVTAHVDSTPEIAKRLRIKVHSTDNTSNPEPARTSPVISGLAVAFGYLLGGLLPLTPYFFVNNVRSGVKWSFAVCIFALFIFGFSKEYVLHINPSSNEWTLRNRVVRWNMIRQSIWEGVRMVVLGGLAAVAAVLCVRLFEGIVPQQPS
ncbi:Ccc1 family [Xylariaceae sp. FL0255]|nr:Ccc1 family [Xylariaceae sp. FL0255]